jgi:hypothetical protein
MYSPGRYPRVVRVDGEAPLAEALEEAFTKVLGALCPDYLEAKVC